MKRMLVALLAVLMVAGGVWAQQARQQNQQQRTQQNNRQMYGDMTGPKARACAYGFNANQMGSMDGQGGMGYHGGMGQMGMMGGQQGMQMGQMGGGRAGIGGPLHFVDFLGMPGTPTSLMMIYHADLIGLDDQQINELEQMYVENQTEMIDQLAELGKAMVRAKQLILQDQAPQQEVNQMIDRVTQGYANLAKAAYRHKQEVYSVLDEQQMQQFSNLQDMQFGMTDGMSDRMADRMNGHSDGMYRNGNQQDRWNQRDDQQKPDQENRSGSGR